MTNAHKQSSDMHDIAMRSNTNKQKKTTVEQNETYIVVEKVIKTGEFYIKPYRERTTNDFL